MKRTWQGRSQASPCHAGVKPGDGVENPKDASIMLINPVKTFLHCFDHNSLYPPVIQYGEIVLVHLWLQGDERAVDGGTSKRLYLEEISAWCESQPELTTLHEFGSQSIQQPVLFLKKEGICATIDKPLIKINEVIGSAPVSSLSDDRDPTWLFKGAIRLPVLGKCGLTANKMRENCLSRRG